jgi:hypothetical protein
MANRGKLLWLSVISIERLLFCHWKGPIAGQIVLLGPVALGLQLPSQSLFYTHAALALPLPPPPSESHPSQKDNMSYN